MHKQVLALNNIGVSLMRKNCFEQAKATFDEAVKVMQQEVSSSEAHGFLLNAHKRLSALQPLTNSYVQVRTQDDFHELLRSQQHPPYREATVFVIVIEDHPFCDNTDGIQQACVIHNFGLSMICLSHSKDAFSMSLHPMSVTYWKEDGERLLQMALSIVESHVGEIRWYNCHILQHLSILHSFNVVLALRISADDREDTYEAFDEGLLYYVSAKRQSVAEVFAFQVAMRNFPCASAA